MITVFIIEAESNLGQFLDSQSVICPQQYPQRQSRESEGRNYRCLEVGYSTALISRKLEPATYLHLPRDPEDEVWKLLPGNSLGHKSNTVKTPFGG